MSHSQLLPYMFKIGSVHSSVRIIKDFLNAHPRVRCSLKPNDNFNVETQAALAQYQSFKQLKVKDDSLNPETYAAIGSEMSPIQLQIATLHDYDQSLERLLYGVLTIQTFDDCVRRAGVGDTGIHWEAADLVLEISRLETISAEAIAVTWQWETGFNFHPLPNINGTKQEPYKNIDNFERWDVGPFHINIYWTKKAIEKKEIDITDIYRATGVNGGSNVYGTMLFEPGSTTTKDKTNWRPARFDGNPLANGRVAARHIKASKGSTEGEKVSNYAPTRQTD